MEKKPGFSTFYDAGDYGYGRSGEHGGGFIDFVILLVTSYGEGGCGSSDDCVGSDDGGGDIMLLWWLW
jgi:hypothetical protein